MLRAALICLVPTASAAFVAHRLQGFDWAAAFRDLAELSAGQIAAALLAVAAAFVAVAGQERAVLAHLALPVASGTGGRAAAAAAAVSQTVGFGPVVGAIVRHRLLPALSMGQSFAISACITLGFFAGLCLLALAAIALLPGMPGQGLARGALVVAVMALFGSALLRGPTLFGLRKPNLIVLVRFLGWLTLDLTALAAVLWVVLPAAPGLDFLTLLPVFLMALGIGVASGSPGGAGPFEATLLTYLPQVEAEALVAGIIAFRVLGYLVPALCGAIWALAGAGGAVAVTAAPLVEHRHVALSTLRTLPCAEVQLVRQGSLTVLSGEGGYLWLSGKLNHTRVVLGSVLTAGVPRLVALQALEWLARSEARMPWLYKIDARLAAVARQRGYAVLPVAREAVLLPARFSESGPERARLRRKLAHARKAGVVVGASGMPSTVEMADVAADWALVHGAERGFSMGRLEAAYVAGQRVITARSRAGVLLAFITLHAGERDWVLDLVRFRPGAPDGTTYAMLCCALEMARAEGVVRLSLAAVPAFGQTGALARMLRCLTRGSAGLSQFKSAFAPTWEVRYAAAPGRLALLAGGLEVAAAILWPGKLGAGRARLVVLQGGGAAKDDQMRAERAA